jgi:hypothetical protein
MTSIGLRKQDLFIYIFQVYDVSSNNERPSKDWQKQKVFCTKHSNTSHKADLRRWFSLLRWKTKWKLPSGTENKEYSWPGNSGNKHLSHDNDAGFKLSYG